MPMDLQSERVPESMPAREPTPRSLSESEALDLHREINERRAQIENPEMLRRLRSL